MGSTIRAWLFLLLFIAGLVTAEHLPFGDGHPRQQLAGGLIALSLFLLGTIGPASRRRARAGSCVVCSTYRWARAHGRVAPNHPLPHHAPCTELSS